MGPHLRGDEPVDDDKETKEDQVGSSDKQFVPDLSVPDEQEYIESEQPL